LIWGIQVTQEQQINIVVVTDLRMPEMNGHEFAVDLLGKKDPPVLIVLTGVTEPKIAKDLLARGVDDIMFKPIDQGVVAAKISALVEQRAARLAADSGALAHPAEEASRASTLPNAPPAAEMTTPGADQESPTRSPDATATSPAPVVQRSTVNALSNPIDATLAVAAAKADVAAGAARSVLRVTARCGKIAKSQ
jgi:hypothetical protein